MTKGHPGVENGRPAVAAHMIRKTKDLWPADNRSGVVSAPFPGHSCFTLVDKNKDRTWRTGMGRCTMVG